MEDEPVGHPHLPDADGSVAVHLLEDAPRQLDGLHAAAESLAEDAFDRPFEASLELREDPHGRLFPQVGGRGLVADDSTGPPPPARRPARTSHGASVAAFASITVLPGRVAE